MRVREEPTKPANILFVFVCATHGEHDRKRASLLLREPWQLPEVENVLTATVPAGMVGWPAQNAECAKRRLRVAFPGCTNEHAGCVPWEHVTCEETVEKESHAPLPEHGFLDATNETGVP